MKKQRKIYMIGIKGVGMTTLAQFFVAAGDKVIGSDISETFMTDKILKKIGVQVKSPFSKNNLIYDADLIINSIAYTEANNPEMKAVSLNKDLQKIRRITYSEALGEVFSAGQGIAVCGSHGKTTTSAWLGYVLFKAGKKPNVLVGSNVPQFKGSGLRGDSKIFVAEADEYGNKLRFMKSHGVLLNNIDYDHPDFFKTEADYVKVFSDFIKQIPSTGFLITNNRDAYSRRLKKYCKGRVADYDVSDDKYSGETVNYLAHDVNIKNGVQYFSVNNFGEFKIKLWGKHNIFNALAVIAGALELKVPISVIKKHLFGFTGTERRAQVLGKYKDAIIIDDYAHHPTEIKATLEGLRAHYPGKILKIVFHPHTFTRTKALFKDFVSSFGLANELIILDIYGSARESVVGTKGVSSKQLVLAVQEFNKKHKIQQTVKNIKDIDSAVDYLRTHLKKDEVMLLMGAGDVFRIGEKLLWPNKKKLKKS
jgi:UDP-N-acetylmuramate--alanine ligase